MQNAALGSSSSTTAGEAEEDARGGEDEEMENVGGQLGGGESVGENKDLSTNGTRSFSKIPSRLFC